MKEKKGNSKPSGGKQDKERKNQTEGLSATSIRCIVFEETGTHVIYDFLQSNAKNTSNCIHNITD